MGSVKVKVCCGADTQWGWRSEAHLTHQSAERGLIMSQAHQCAAAITQGIKPRVLFWWLLTSHTHSTHSHNGRSSRREVSFKAHIWGGQHEKNGNTLASDRHNRLRIYDSATYHMYSTAGWKLVRLANAVLLSADDYCWFISFFFLDVFIPVHLQGHNPVYFTGWILLVFFSQGNTFSITW